MRTLYASLVVFFSASAAHAAEPEPVPTTPGDSWFAPSQTQESQPRGRSKPSVSEDSASVKVTVQRSTNPPPPESTPSAPTSPSPSPSPVADKPVESPARHDPLVDSRFLSGFRIGYAYTANDQKPLASLDGKSFREAVGTRSPHSFLLGYEIMVRMIGHGWLNVILTS